MDGNCSLVWFYKLDAKLDVIWFVSLIPVGCQVCLWIWWQMGLRCHCNYQYYSLPYDLAQAAARSCDWTLILYPYTWSSMNWNPFQVRNKRVCWPQCMIDFFLSCLESTTKCILFGRIASVGGNDINRKLFPRAPKRGVSESASSWHCSPCAKWITSLVTSNYHLRWFSKWFSLLSVPFGQPFLGL